MSIGIAAVGLQHAHAHNQIKMLCEAGARLHWVYESDPELMAAFVSTYPTAKAARHLDEILDDPSVHLVIGTTAPSERAPLGITVMRAGKDYSCAKPGIVSLEQLLQVRQVQAETQRIFTVHFGERYENAATVKAGELVHAGAVGRIVQTLGMGPHRFLGHIPRPDWVFDARNYGGIINDLASHQIEQFLYFTGSTTAEIVQSQVGNFKHTQFPHFQDFGDLTLRSDKATGYIRVDWLTPRGLNSWGDGRLFLLGTEGYIEIRKNIDISGRPGKDHLFIVDEESARYLDCKDTPLTYGRDLVYNVLHRTHTAFDQARCFLTCELSLVAQTQAKSITGDTIDDKYSVR